MQTVRERERERETNNTRRIYKYAEFPNHSATVTAIFFLPGRLFPAILETDGEGGARKKEKKKSYVK